MTFAPPAPHDTNAPSRINRYDIIAEIASGGMATVFLGRLGGVGGFQRLVAIKRLHPHLATEQDFVSMFLDEARLVASIHHPNVVPILEVDESPQGYYLVMEYVEGDTLASLIAQTVSARKKESESEGSKPVGRSGLPVPSVARIMLDLLNGLHAAHELKDELGVAAGLVHRDVSPQNVLCGIDGVSRITDFGVAQAVSRLSATKAGQLKGKIAYMAPEQANPDARIDRRIDVFAAGVVLWEAVTGRRLFKSANDAATLKRVLELEIPHVSEIESSVPRVLGDVCAKALERSPEARYQDCRSFAEALENAATEINQLGSARDVARLVEKMAGNKIEGYRLSVREWLLRNEESAPSKSSSRLLSSAGLAGTTVAGTGEALPLDFTISAEAHGQNEKTVDHYVGRGRPQRTVVLLAVTIGVVGIVGLGTWLSRRDDGTEKTDVGAKRAPAVANTGQPLSEPVPGNGQGGQPHDDSNAGEGAEEKSSAGDDAVSPQALPRIRVESAPAREQARRPPPSGGKPAAKPSVEGFESIDRENPYR